MVYTVSQNIIYHYNDHLPFAIFLKLANIMIFFQFLFKVELKIIMITGIKLKVQGYAHAQWSESQHAHFNEKKDYINAKYYLFGSDSGS